MLISETAAEQETVVLIAVAIAVGIVAAAFLALRFFSLLIDRDDVGLWVMAIDPARSCDPWLSRFDCAIAFDRICGSSFFSLTWPTRIYQRLEDGLGYDHGIEYRGNEQIDDAVACARRYWGRKRVFTRFPAIRRRLDRQLSSFCRIAHFAKSKNLILLLLFLASDDVPDSVQRIGEVAQ